MDPGCFSIETKRCSGARDVDHDAPVSRIQRDQHQSNGDYSQARYHTPQASAVPVTDQRGPSDLYMRATPNPRQRHGVGGEMSHASNR